MHNFDLILTLTGCLGAALVLGYGAHRLGMSPIVGYLLAGIAVGPHTPGFVADRQMAEQVAEIGVVLLMFGVGLQFHVDELLAVRGIAVPGALIQSFVATALGAAVARAFGWSWTAGIVFGLAISVASTVVLVRVLADNHDLHTPTGHIAVGWLVVEDLFTVLMLVLLPSFFGAEGQGVGQILVVLGVAVLKIGVLAAFTLVVGGRIFPWLLARAAATRSRELFTLTVLVLALGIAVGSTKLFGVSMALGAFLAGMVVGRSDFSLRAATEALPMRDAFAVLFFVSVGMLLDPRHFVDEAGLVVATLAVIMLGKPLTALAIVLARGYAPKVALGVAVALGQIGEFSFIVASLGNSLTILTDTATNTLIAAAIVAITVNPLVYRCIHPLDAWIARTPSLTRWLPALRSNAGVGGVAAGGNVALTPAPHHAVVVGYGPVGQTVARLLRQNEIQPTVIEMNLETVHRLREAGISAVYGDGRHQATLAQAGVASAGSLVLSSAAMEGSEEIIHLARELNPTIRILARTSYTRQVPPLRNAGATAVFSGEAEVALAFTTAILQELGATPEQIDRERERVHLEMFGTSSLLDPQSHATGAHVTSETDEAKPRCAEVPATLNDDPICQSSASEPSPGDGPPPSDSHSDAASG